MFARLYHALAIVSIATLLAVGGLVGLLCGTDRLTGERAEMIARILRGEEPLPQPTSAPAPQTQPAEQPTEGVSAAELLRRQRRAEQLRRALGDRAYQDLLAQRRLVEQALQHLINEQERFDASVAAWKQEQERRRGELLDEGFAKECNLVAKLSAKLAKEHVVLKWKKSPADVVRLFNALPESTGKRILEQMKTPEEIQIMHELLERLSAEQAVEAP